MMVNAFMIHMLSPACYNALRSNFLLILPHKSQLIQLTQSLSVSVEDVKENKYFLKQRAGTLNDREKYIVMQIEKIYVKSKLDYKNSKVYGYAESSAENNLQAARTIYVIFVSSAFGHFLEVVSLKLVKKITADELTKIVEDAAVLLRETGLKVTLRRKKKEKLLCNIVK